MIDYLVEKLLQDDDLETAFVAYSTHKKFWRKEGDSYQRLTGKIYEPRQTSVNLLREDAGMACATRTEVIKQGYRIGDNVYILENHDEYSMIDIHDERSLFLAEKALEREKERENYEYFY